jgi:glycosyltransferase involved in cell wall biosynthesis
MGKSSVWVVIAAFNEAQVIADTVTNILAHFDNVVVTDDCSQDETATHALTAGAHVLIHPINLGQGAALQTGIDYALKNGAEYIVTFDADGQHNAEEIAPMLSALQSNCADVALGSRFIGKVLNISWQRKLLLILALVYTRITLKIKLTDVHNGFRILTRRFCLSFKFQQNRMAHASEILNYISDQNVRYIEYPVTIAYTQYSVHKGQKGQGAMRILMELFLGKLSK